MQHQFGKRLKELREAANLSQEELARIAQLALRSIENWEQGRNEPKFAALVKLADALKVPLDEFRCLPDQQA